jgi:hypothetical protein
MSNGELSLQEGGSPSFGGSMEDSRRKALSVYKQKALRRR